MSESPSTDDDLVLTLAGNAFDVLIVALGMAVLALLLWMVYRTMQHPRLPVVRTADRAPAVTWPGALRYLLTTPPMVGFWFVIILFLLAAAAGERTPGDVLIAATAVVGGARLLAHFNEEIAHELAKTVPITILGFIIIGGGFAGSDRFSQVWEGLPVDTFDTYWWGLIGFDVLITAAWFGGQRLHWHWVRHRREAGLPIENPLTRLWNRWRAVGYGSTSKESS
ncbi:MAG: hypothetical protein U0R64_10140 [Candidatus Nanopelagicales bacterium]